MSDKRVLSVEDLRTYYYSRGKQAFIRSVDGVSFHVDRGETLGIVGESGSGKSVTVQSVMGLITGEPGVITGNVWFAPEGTHRDLLEGLGDFVRVERSDGRIMSVQKDIRGWQRHLDKTMTGVRGKEISMIFQDPKSSMNPFMTVGQQISEAIRLNTSIKNRREADEKAISWLELVRMDSPRLRFNSYPSSLSGGMCQRAMIAMALACEPSLLIADEPTTGLDATIQSMIVDLMAELKARISTTTLLISHDISVISRLSDKVAVMYGGTVMEYGPAAEILSPGSGKKHPYTSALLSSIPGPEHIREKLRLQAIQGDVLDTINLPSGCRFQARCGKKTAGIKDMCEGHQPELKEAAPGHQVRCWLYSEQLQTSG